MMWLIRLIMIQGTVAPEGAGVGAFCTPKIVLDMGYTSLQGILHFTGLQLVEFGSLFRS